MKGFFGLSLYIEIFQPKGGEADTPSIVRCLLSPAVCGIRFHLKYFWRSKKNV